MLFKSSVVALVLQATSTLATWSAYEEYLSGLPKHTSKHQGARPRISYSPKQPYEPFPKSPARGKVCYVKSHDDFKTDDSPYILDAINKCNNGGHVIFSQGTSYVIGTALDLTFLKHIDIGEFVEVDAKESNRASLSTWQASNHDVPWLT